MTQIALLPLPRQGSGARDQLSATAFGGQLLPCVLRLAPLAYCPLLTACCLLSCCLKPRAERSSNLPPRNAYLKRAISPLPSLSLTLGKRQGDGDVDLVILVPVDGNDAAMLVEHHLG